MRILLYANSRERSRVLLPWVQGLASRYPTQVTVQVTREPSHGERAAAEMFKHELEAAGTVRLEAIRTEEERPEGAIAHEAVRGGYDMLILTPAGRRGLTRLVQGSMVAKVVRRVNTSILIVRAGAVPPRRILACVSGSRHSLTNVRAAAQMGVAFEATVTVFMVLSELPVAFASLPPGSRRDDFLASDHPLAVHLRTAEDLLRKLGAQGGVRVREGLVVDEILDELEVADHDLLVLGTHRAEDYDPMYEDLTSELVQKSGRTTLVVGLRADLL